MSLIIHLSVDVVHGPHKWTIKKRYHNFFKLHTAILFLHHEKSNLSPVGASEEECESSESNFKEGSKPNHPSCNADKVRQGPNINGQFVIHGFPCSFHENRINTNKCN